MVLILGFAVFNHIVYLLVESGININVWNYHGQVIALLILETDGYHASLPKSLGSHFDSHFFVLM